MQGKATKVLIVEDDPDFAESLVIALGIRSCEVDVVRSGEEAVSKFQDQVYDIAFMDIKLPGKNGVESLQEIIELCPEARVVMMTGFTEPSLLEQARKAGAMQVLRKPFRMRELLDIIDCLKGSPGADPGSTRH